MLKFENLVFKRNTSLNDLLCDEPCKITTADTSTVLKTDIVTLILEVKEMALINVK